jgi:hypothetical protein
VSDDDARPFGYDDFIGVPHPAVVARCYVCGRYVGQWWDYDGRVSRYDDPSPESLPSCDHGGVVPDDVLDAALARWQRTGKTVKVRTRGE